jgi:hypothetical protein
MESLTLSYIRDNFSGGYVKFKLKENSKIYFGKIMMLIYNTVNRKVTTPFCLDFDIIKNPGEFFGDETKWSFKQFSVYEGQIEAIEIWRC